MKGLFYAKIDREDRKVRSPRPLGARASLFSLRIPFIALRENAYSFSASSFLIRLRDWGAMPR